MIFLASKGVHESSDFLLGGDDMDRDSNDIIASQIINGMIGGVLILTGLSMIIWGWGPGGVGGVALMLGGVAYPLFKLYRESERKASSASRKREREPRGDYEIRSKGYSERRRQK